MAALLVAGLIYKRQSRQGEQWADEINDNTEQTIRRYASFVDLDPDALSGSDESDSLPYETGLIEQVGMDLGHGVRAFQRDDVPLGVLHKTVNAWRAEGKKGDWTVGSLVGALRKTGSGNHPWYLAFEDGGVTRLWKLSGGGRGKSDPTLTEVALTSDAAAALK